MPSSRRSDDVLILILSTRSPSPSTSQVIPGSGDNQGSLLVTYFNTHAEPVNHFHKKNPRSAEAAFSATPAKPAKTKAGAAAAAAAEAKKKKDRTPKWQRINQADRRSGEDDMETVDKAAEPPLRSKGAESTLPRIFAFTEKRSAASKPAKKANGKGAGEGSAGAPPASKKKKDAAAADALLASPSHKKKDSESIPAVAQQPLPHVTASEVGPVKRSGEEDMLTIGPGQQQRPGGDGGSAPITGWPESAPSGAPAQRQESQQQSQQQGQQQLQQQRQQQQQLQQGGGGLQQAQAQEGLAVVGAAAGAPRFSPPSLRQPLPQSLPSLSPLTASRRPLLRSWQGGRVWAGGALRPGRPCPPRLRPRRPQGAPRAALAATPVLCSSGLAQQEAAMRVSLTPSPCASPQMMMGRVGRFWWSQDQAASPSEAVRLISGPEADPFAWHAGGRTSAGGASRPRSATTADWARW